MKINKKAFNALSGFRQKLADKKKAKNCNDEILSEWNKVRGMYPNFIQWMDEVWERREAGD